MLVKPGAIEFYEGKTAPYMSWDGRNYDDDYFTRIYIVEEQAEDEACEAVDGAGAPAADEEQEAKVGAEHHGAGADGKTDENLVDNEEARQK